jgi:hypothetical protein
VIGAPEALWICYGTDPAEAEGVLTTPAVTKAELARKGEVYRQVLSLLLAGRRPAYYLNRDGTALAALSESYLREIGFLSIGPTLSIISRWRCLDWANKRKILSIFIKRWLLLISL